MPSRGSRARLENLRTHFWVDRLFHGALFLWRYDLESGGPRKVHRVLSWRPNCATALLPHERTPLVPRRT